MAGLGRAGGLHRLVVAETGLFQPRRALAACLAHVACLSLVLIGIAWLKCEPRRWDWGDN